MSSPSAASVDRRAVSVRRMRRLLIAAGGMVPLLYLVAWRFAPDCANGGSDLMATLLIPLLLPVIAIGLIALQRRPASPPSARSVQVHAVAVVVMTACAVPLVTVAAIRLWVSASGGELSGCLVF